MAASRPVYLDLLKIRQPLPAVVSILHRITGVALFLAIPVLLPALQLSLSSEAGFEAVRQSLASPLVKLGAIGLLWSFLHHFFAGLRFLALDIGLGLELRQTRRYSALVLAAGIVCALSIGVWLW
jgi:succinate dehydrogenase / fumarate reductase cytochrome b subunit